MVRRYANISAEPMDGTQDDAYYCDDCLKAVADGGHIWRSCVDGEIIPVGFAIGGAQYDHLEDAPDHSCEECGS